MKVEPIKDLDLIRDILEYLENKNKRDYVLFATGIYTGLRMSDILGLRIKDICDKKILRVKQKKTGEFIEIPINTRLKRIYKDYSEDKELSDYLVRNERISINRPIQRDRAYKILNKVADRYGLNRIGTHTLRKTYGYHMYKLTGNNIGLVMKALGQKEPSSTLAYIGVADIDIKKGIDMLNF